MAPKTDKSVWVKVKAEYQAGSFKSVMELASRYGINNFTLQTRIAREHWKEDRERLLTKVSEKVERKCLSQAEEYLSSSFLRAKKYEKMLDASQENFGSKTSEGIPLLDPDALDTYSRSELRIHELAKSSLRIAAVSQVDITSKGQSLGDIVSAISKLRSDPTKMIELTPEQVKLISESDVEG